MALLFFHTTANGMGELLLRRLLEIAPRGGLETFHELGSFANRVNSTPSCASVAILMAADREILLGLHAIRHLLEDMRVLLVVPDGDPETVRLAHDLAPRFLSYLDDDPSHLLAVLERMLRRAQGGEVS